MRPREDLSKNAEYRNFDCPKYPECLDAAARVRGGNGPMHCKGCDPEKVILEKVTRNIPEIIPLIPKIKNILKEENAMPSKKCTHCKQIKDFSEFSKNKATKDGFEYHCRDCKKEEQRILRERRHNEVSGGNGPRKKIVQDPLRAGGPSRPEAVPRRLPIPWPLTDGIYLPAEAIKAIKKSVGKQLIQEFSKFIEERYA